MQGNCATISTHVVISHLQLMSERVAGRQPTERIVQVNPSMAKRLESSQALKDTSKQRNSSRRVAGRYVNQVCALHC